MTETEIKEIVQKQRSYFYTGATLPVEKRLDALKKLKTCIQKYEPDTADFAGSFSVVPCFRLKIQAVVFGQSCAS